MLIAAVAMAGLLGWSQDVGPAELVARLGSSRFAEREAAAVSLRRLGDSALPALRQARSAADPEIRIRAAKVREEIEAACGEALRYAQPSYQIVKRHLEGHTAKVIPISTALKLRQKGPEIRPIAEYQAFWDHITGKKP